MNGGMRAALLTRVAALSLSVSACCRCEPPGPPEPADSASTAPHGFNASPRIDAVTMTGAGGAYRVENAVLCWDEPSLQGPYQAVIGSNLFDQVSVVFDGVQNTLGIISSGS